MSQSTSTQANGTPVPNKASEVGWLFVPQYYTFMNKDPSRLHCFYTKKSTMVHGTENEDITPSVGQQAIHERVNTIGFEDTKVYVSNVDSQSSADGGIVIQVLGEMSNKGGKWRKFAQTFFLAQQPNGFYVLNDIFRYLKDDDDEKDEAREDEPQADEAAPVSVADTPAAREATEASQHAAPAKDEAKPAAPAPAEPAAHAEPKEAPAAPPKTWANLAARGANRWGHTASEARGSSEAGAQATSTAAAAPGAKAALGARQARRAPRSWPTRSRVHQECGGRGAGRVAPVARGSVWRAEGVPAECGQGLCVCRVCRRRQGAPRDPDEQLAEWRARRRSDGAD